MLYPYKIAKNQGANPISEHRTLETARHKKMILLKMGRWNGNHIYRWYESTQKWMAVF